MLKLCLLLPYLELSIAYLLLPPPPSLPPLPLPRFPSRIVAKPLSLVGVCPRQYRPSAPSLPHSGPKYLASCLQL
jgi:hypothetical protein